MKRMIVSIFSLLLIGSVGWAESAETNSLISYRFIEKAFWYEIKSTLKGRCRRYTPDEYRACDQATTNSIQILRENIPRKDKSRDIFSAAVIFKPELLAYLKDPSTNQLFDFWIQELRLMRDTQRWESSLFDKTVQYLGSEERAFQAFAVLMQDITSYSLLFSWIPSIEDPQVKSFDISKLEILISMVRSVPPEASQIFYPSRLRSSSKGFFRSAFYHFYVPGYLYKKLKATTDPSYAATVVFLFNYMYENLTENGFLKARFVDPQKMRNERNLNDIRLAYLGISWVEYGHNTSLLYAQNAFLKLEEERLKDHLRLWIDRFF